MNWWIEHKSMLRYNIHVLMRDEKEERKKQARSNKQTRQKQHSTPKAVTFRKKNELPRVGLDVLVHGNTCA